MRWRRSIRWINALLLIGTVGCRSAQVTYFGNAELQHYRDKMLAVEYPNVDQTTPQEVAYSQHPRTIKEPTDDEIWEMTLMQAVQTAVTNNKMIRSRTNGPQLLANPAVSPSVYDPAIGETGFLFGNRGVEAALADFDAQLTASTQWGNNATIQNSFGTFQNNSDTGSFSSGLSKSLATGGSFSVNHNWNYLSTNSPFVPVSSSYTGTLQAAFTQPLWAGAGVEYNRIAGPPRAGLGSITGVSQGVSIARINCDIDVADFELAVIQMVKDVEDLYWELYLAYRQYDAEVANRESVHRSWIEVKAKMDAGARGGSAADEAQARENYFDAQSRVEQTLSNIFITENQFRKQLGLAVNDGRIIRPHDDPMEAEFVVQWESGVLDALTRRPELRRQKWNIKSLELQYRAAQNVANPTLNFVSSYQVNGFGSNLLSYTDSPNNSMYTSMGNTNLTGWTTGLQFAMPLGLRAARMQLHNIELQLVKARAALAAQEQDINHDLAEAVQRIDAAYRVAQTQLDRKIAAVKRVEATMALYEVGARDEQNQGVTLDLVLRAQAANAAAEIAYFTALINYNKAITEFHWRRGMLLEVDGIHVAEGDWDAAAKEDALKRAWERSYGRPAEYLEMQPEEYGSGMPSPKTDLYPGLPQGAEVHSISDPTGSPTLAPTLPAPAAESAGKARIE
ncbi:MAG: outer rane efflux protein [Schlesneria sp.]|nr:outer rane efflux protein [Schlesneria sp.]